MPFACERTFRCADHGMTEAVQYTRHGDICVTVLDNEDWDIQKRIYRVPEEYA